MIKNKGIRKTCADSPLGNSTTQWETMVEDWKKETEQTIWSLALVSMTQVSTPKAVLFTSLAENMECLRLLARGVD